MVVDIQDGLDARVSQAGGDDGGTSALGDEEGDVAMPKIVKPDWLTYRIRLGGLACRASVSSHVVCSHGSAPTRSRDR